MGLAVAVSAVLAFEQPLHGLVARIGAQDLLQLWLLVVITSALSMVGYVAMRRLGVARGTAVIGIAGGLVGLAAGAAR